jgi:hypothetical protein
VNNENSSYRSNSISRRNFVGISLGAVAAGFGSEPAFAEPKRIAAIITTFFRMSHAEVIVGRLLKGYYYNGERQHPRINIVSMYVDQFPNEQFVHRTAPDSDMSRDMAKQHGVPICKNIREALTLGGDDLAVDGVVIIGEHGIYPYNIKGQELYPRYHFFKQVVDVFSATGKVVPVYIDKHFSYNWDEAKWMYDQSVAMGFPMMAGSSLPVTWREPELELDIETPITKAVAIGRGPKERYGFHLLEMLQCMVERRKGGETGVSAVQCLEGSHVWNWTDTHPWAKRLLEEALARSAKNKSGSPRDNVSHPILFILEYRSGLQAACYLLNGHVSTSAFIADIDGRKDPIYCKFILQGRPYGHFSGLAHFIEEMMITGIPSYPVERTLLTTGVLEASFDSTYENGSIVELGRRLATPHLDIAYRAQKESLFNLGPMPPTEKDFGIGP